MVKLNSLHLFERAELVNLGNSCSTPDYALILYCFLLNSILFLTKQYCCFQYM